MDKQTLGAILGLRFLAYITLILGCIGAILIILLDIFDSTSINIAIALGVVFGTLLVYYFLLVICGIAENLIEIRKNTFKGAGKEVKR